jgi:methionine-gamma-lyase
MAKWEYTDKPMHSEHRRADDRYLDRRLETQCLHAGERWEKHDIWTSSTPIFNSTTYFYDSFQDLEDRIYYRKPGYVYSRGGSPTNTTLERAISTLERAEVTHVCSSGMAASTRRGDARLFVGDGCQPPGTADGRRGPRRIDPLLQRCVR